MDEDKKRVKELIREIERRHDYAFKFKGSLTKVQMEAIQEDLKQVLQVRSFLEVETNADDVNKVESYVLLIAVEDHAKILQQAERQKLSRPESIETPEYRKMLNSEIEKQLKAKELDPEVTIAEFRAKYQSEQPLVRSDLMPTKKAAKPVSAATSTTSAGGQDEFSGDIYLKISEADRLRLSYQLLLQVSMAQMKKTETIVDQKKFKRFDKREGFIDFMKRHHLLKDMTALHSRSMAVTEYLHILRDGGKKKTGPFSAIGETMKRWDAPVEVIRDYYGDEIALYFEWMNFFIMWIFIPGCLGLAIRIINMLFFTDSSTSPFNAVFSIMMAYWGALFSIFWKRRQRGLRIQWDNLYYSERKFEQIREDFVGVPKINPITEVVEPYYSETSRQIKYLESAIICLPFFGLIFVFLVACYNITGVILPDGKHDIFHLPLLADLAKPGALFDAESNMAYVTSIGQVILTMFLNKYFRQVATLLTDRENHKYQSTYNNSLLCKRFVFEFFDCFLPLIYFGWWELNYKVLRQNVISLYMADEIRRVVTESLIPYLTQNKSKKDIKKLNFELKVIKALWELEKTSGDNLAKKRKEFCVLWELEELERDEHEIFDDYLEMIMTFGYITMFASVFPLGATIIVIFIYIETRSDIFRLEKTLRRPIPEKTFHIGSWSAIIEIFCILAVFSNIIICCYASKQIDYLFPWLMNYRDSEATSLFTVGILEHFLLFSIFIIKLTLDKNPDWVDVFLARKAHKAERDTLQKLDTQKEFM